MKGIALVISLSAILSAAHAQSLRSQIESANKAIHKCMMAKDVKSFTKIMKGNVTSDFTYEEAGRKMNFNQMVQGMTMGLGQMKKMIKAEAKLLSLKEKGNSATATTFHTMEGTMSMGDPKIHKMSFSGVSTETYVKQGGKWKLAKMAWGKQTMTMDGKPMNAAMSAPAWSK